LKTIISSVKKAFIGYCRSSQELSKGPLIQPEGSRNFQEEVRAELNIKQEAYLWNCKGLGMVEAEVQRKDRKWVGKAGP
jgi:hypothetical protein